jgi:hypothetical protein
VAWVAEFSLGLGRWQAAGDGEVDDDVESLPQS